MTHDTTAMILAAGLGTRLKALTQDKPKALVELNGKPLLQHCIENLIANGFHHIVINVHHFGEQIIDFVESHHFDAEIEISDERDLLMDTGGGIVKATPLFKDSKAVLVHNVDIISDVDLGEMSQEFLASGDDAWLLTQDRETNRKLVFGDDDQLIGWRNKAEESDRLKSAFIANMSHEIRTPLNAIIGFTSLLPDITGEEERRQLIDLISENNQKLLQIIDDVMKISKIEAGNDQLFVSTFDLNTVHIPNVRSGIRRFSRNGLLHTNTNIGVTRISHSKSTR